MKNVDLRVKATKFLQDQSKAIVKPPHKLVFSARQLSESVGGYAGALGKVAHLIVADLEALGVRCSYDRSRSPTLFIIEVPEF